MLPIPEWYPKSLGHEEHLRSQPCWAPLLHTKTSGAVLFQGSLRGEQLFAALVSSVDWVVTGHSAHGVGGKPAMPLPICEWSLISHWATNRRAPGSCFEICGGPLHFLWLLGFSEGGCAGERELEPLRWLVVVCTPRRRGSFRKAGRVQAHCFSECLVFSDFPLETWVHSGLWC